MDEKESNIVSSMREMFESFESNLEDKISEIESNMENRMNAFELNMDNRMNAFELNMENRMNAFESNMENRMNAFESNIEDKISDFKMETKNRFDSMEKTVKGIDNRLQSLENIVTRMEHEHGEKLAAVLDGYKTNVENHEDIYKRLENLEVKSESYDANFLFLNSKIGNN